MGKEQKTAPDQDLKKLEKKVKGLSSLFQVSAIISSTLNLNDLMNIVMDKAKQEMEAEACSILFYNKETNKLEFEVAISRDEQTSCVLKKKITLDMGQGIAGWVAENLKTLVIDDVSADERFYTGADKQTGFTTRNIIAVPLIGRRGLIGVVEIINPGRKDYDLEVFDILCKQFAVAIENALLHRESIDKEKLKQELEIAASLQKSFLPELPAFHKGKVTVTGVNIPASKIGGDLYDFIEPVEGKVGIFIGDVSGKGVSGALYMAKIISDFRYTALSKHSPDTVFNCLNNAFASSPRGMFCTAIYMIVDTETGHLQCSVAGHPSFLWLTGNEVKVMDVLAGPPLGIIPDEYPSTSLSLKDGDRLLLFTDGVFEAKNREGKRLGFDALTKFVKTHMNSGKLVEDVVDYVKAFSKGTEMADDLTIVELKWGE